MYFSDALRVVARQWIVVLIGLLLIGSASVMAYLVVPTNHQASGQVLFLPPSVSEEREGVSNPYLLLPGGLILTATLVATAQTTLDTQRELEDAGLTSSYAVAVPPGTGPLIAISVEDTDAALALATRKELIERIQLELTTIQEVENVPDDQLIIAREFNVARDAEVLAGNKIRAIGASVAFGTLLTAFSVFGVDRRSARRRQRTEDGSPSTGSSAALPGEAGNELRPPNAETSIELERTG